MNASRMDERKEDGKLKARREIPAHWAPATTGLTRNCCGKAIYAQSIEVKDSAGQSYFASVWHCPTCGRLTT